MLKSILPDKSIDPYLEMAESTLIWDQKKRIIPKSSPFDIAEYCIAPKIISNKDQSLLDYLKVKILQIHHHVCFLLIEPQHIMHTEKGFR